MPTYVISGDAADGWLTSLVPNGTGNYVNDYAQFLAVGQIVSVSGSNYYEGCLAFDTSVVVGTITSATLSLYEWSGGTLVQNDFTIEARLYDWSPTLTGTDWVPATGLGALPLVATLTTVGLGSDTFNDFTSLPAFLTNIDQGGFTYLLLNSDHHRLGTSTPDIQEVVTFKSGNATDPVLHPKLTIVTVDCVPPANDDWANAEVLVGESGSVTGTTACATFEAGEPTIVGSGADPQSNTVWYVITPPAQGVMEFLLTDSGGLRFDIETYTGATLASLYGPIAGLSGVASATPMTVYMTINAQGFPAVKPYWVRVHSDAAGESGPFTISWSFTPSPPARNLLPRNPGRGRLGCGENVAYLTWKCGTPRFCPLPTASDITWNRHLNDISEATVVIPLSGNADDTCCDCLGDVEPWCHELHIARDGQDVWLGPVTEVVYEFNQVTIKALDLLGWSTVRVAEVDIDYTAATGAGPADWTTIGMAILDVAFAEDDPCILPYVSQQLSGYVGEQKFTAYDLSAFDQLDQLAGTGLEYTVVGRTIILASPNVPTTPIATLMDGHILGAVQLTKSGLLQADRWFVHFDKDADAIPPGPGMAEAANQYCYGLLERIRSTDTALANVESADIVANVYVAASAIAPRLLEIPDGSRLSPEAPWTIDQMIPGCRVDVGITRLCVNATQSFVLTGVGVRQTKAGEEVTVTLGPVNVLTAGL